MEVKPQPPKSRLHKRFLGTWVRSPRVALYSLAYFRGVFLLISCEAKESLWMTFGPVAVFYQAMEVLIFISQGVH